MSSPPSPPPPSPSATQELYDCGALLQYVADCEAAYQDQNLREEETVSFGHPDPPKLHLMDLASSTSNTTKPVWMVAYTVHCAAAQLLVPAGLPDNYSDTAPMDICTILPPNDNNNDEPSSSHAPTLDEAITCLTVLALDSHSVSSLLQESNDNSSMVDQRLAVVLGTNQGRVFSVEVSLNCTSWTTRRLTWNDNSASLFRVLPCDLHTVVESSTTDVPFQPTGAVTSLSPFRSAAAVTTMAAAVLPVHVWVAYADGTMVRLHHAGFFPCVWQSSAAAEQSLETALRGPGAALVRCQAHLPFSVVGWKVQPLPRYFPSPLAPLSVWKSTALVSDGINDDATMDAVSLTTSPDLSPEEGDMEEHDEACYEALVFGSQAAATEDNFPTVCFYTSENQFRISNPSSRIGSGGTSRQAMLNGTSAAGNIVLGAVVGGTKALVGGMFGWLGGKSATTEEVSDDDAAAPDGKDAMEESVEEEHEKLPLPSLSQAPVGLFASHELHDMPRKVESCSVDPDGNLAALADNLGRVLLIDLSTKQVVRMWKGFRDASCYWLEAPQQEDSGSTMKSAMYLVIHSRQRRVVEVWRARHGSRLCSVQVGRDAQVVPCYLGLNATAGASCYLVHSNVPGTSFNQTEKIKADGLESLCASDQRQRVVMKTPSTPSSREAILQLQHLQQLLSTTNVQCRAVDVDKALREISSLADLATALDRLAGASVLEEKMGVHGSDFQKAALGYCKDFLGTAVKGIDGTVQSNPNVQMLSRKIQYHSQIVNAYDILARFENRSQDDGEGARDTRTQDHWTAEAMGWVSTYEQVMGVKPGESPPTETATCRFSDFAAACAFPKGSGTDGTRMQVRLSESSRIRRVVLVHIFSPLLADVFSFGVVNSIFDALGIVDEKDYLLHLVGEWFMTLTPQEIHEKGMTLVNSPVVRWLQDVASQQLEDRSADQYASVLNAISKFCEESSELVHAFMLATVCREAVGKAAMQKEKLTYGKISSSQEVSEWESLLRRLRICLLVSLRLKDKRLGSFPISVNNVNKGDLFSVYEWLAHDELAMSHNHEEIVSLEKACQNSSYSFDPSGPDGDGPSRFGMLQNSCLSAAVSEDERAEYLIDFNDDDKFGALLLYLRSHNDPTMLVAHRALLLASAWSQEPGNLTVLEDSLTALTALSTTGSDEPLAKAVRLDVFQSQIRPIYRAHLFGFDDVQEVSENVVAPLLQSQEWLREFGRIALQILTLLTNLSWNQDAIQAFESRLGSDDALRTWPPVQADFALKRLVEKGRQVDASALDAHRVVLSALLISDDIKTLVQCAPAIYECFLPLALFNPVTTTCNTAIAQRGFLEDAVIARANAYSGQAIDGFDLGEIVTLAKIWAVELKDVRTVFLLAMYELEKDSIVDELLTKSAAQIDIARFVEDGVDIVCRRLDHFLSGSRGKSTEMRNVLGQLDADLCEWIRQRADKSRSLIVVSPMGIPVDSTHLFCLRLLTLGGSSNVDTTLRVKIHSLVVLTGTLRKALETEGS